MTSYLKILENGNIMDLDRNETIVVSYKHTPPLVTDTFNSFYNMVISKRYEGTLVTFFLHNNERYISTRTNINVYNTNARIQAQEFNDMGLVTYTDLIKEAISKWPQTSSWVVSEDKELVNIITPKSIDDLFHNGFAFTFILCDGRNQITNLNHILEPKLIYCYTTVRGKTYSKMLPIHQEYGDAEVIVLDVPRFEFLSYDSALSYLKQGGAVYIYDKNSPHESIPIFSPKYNEIVNIMSDPNSLNISRYTKWCDLIDSTPELENVFIDNLPIMVKNAIKIDPKLYYMKLYEKHFKVVYDHVDDVLQKTLSYGTVTFNNRFPNYVIKKLERIVYKNKQNRKDINNALIEISKYLKSLDKRLISKMSSGIKRQ